MWCWCRLLSLLMDFVLQTVLSHGLGAAAGVAARTIPVPRNRLGIKVCYDSRVFTHSVQDETSNPEMMSHVSSFTGSYQELPAGGHELGTFLHNLDGGMRGAPVVSLHCILAIGSVCSQATVVWTLGPREAIGRPTKRVPICTHKSIFLLHPKLCPLSVYRPAFNWSLQAFSCT